MELVLVTIAIVAAIFAAVYLLDEIIWVCTSSVRMILGSLKCAIKGVGKVQSWVCESIRSFRNYPTRLLLVD